MSSKRQTNGTVTAGFATLSAKEERYLDFALHQTPSDDESLVNLYYALKEYAEKSNDCLLAGTLNAAAVTIEKLRREREQIGKKE